MKQILSIVLLLFKWWFGARAEREQRAKEIAEGFEKITKEGDNLSIQLRTNLNKRSDAAWEDIELRGE